MTMPNASEHSGQRFLIDLMLMRLGRWLRLMGQDVANPREESDRSIMEQAGEERRTIITRDRKLFQACCKGGQPCLFICSSRIEGQLMEMVGAGVPLRLEPKRCTICNGPLEEIREGEKEQWQCQKCHKVYWQGSHWKKMEMMLEEICSIR